MHREFKVGDKVRVNCVSGDVCRGSRHKKGYGFISEIADYSVRVDIGDGCKGICNWHDIKCVTLGENKMSTENEYSFKVKHPDMIDFSEIKISRDNPIAIVTIKGEATVIYFYESIIAKADALGIPMPGHSVHNDGDGVILCETGEEVGEAINALKAIIKAPWNSGACEVTIKLIGVG